jgi:hypothetical protein
MSTPSATKRMKTSRWAMAALPIRFTGLKYPKVSSYPMITKNMMDFRNPNHG